MIASIIKNRHLVVIFHLILGALFTFSIFSKLYAVTVIGCGVYLIYINENRNEEALLFSSYLVSLEVLLRMTGGAVVYEIGKYGVTLFLILGMIWGKKGVKAPLVYLIYTLLLLLGIVLTSVPEGESIRKTIVFNLSGPILVGICAVYCYRRKLTYQKVLEILFFAILPIVSMVIFLFFRTPTLSEIAFGTQANFETSGGFGPNQVATAIGLGILALAILKIQRVKVTRYYILDLLILLYFIYRGLLTFSRGGMLAALIVLVVFVFFIFRTKSYSREVIIKNILISFTFLLAIWLYTSNITGGMISNRYAGKDAIGRQKKDITTGRARILEMQLDEFYESPIFGIGVGNGKFRRAEIDEKYGLASHNELSRLIEEHGLIGVFMLILLFSEPIMFAYQSTNFQRAFMISFFLLWFLTIAHSGMRIALPSFFYGLSLINITNYEET